jgi:hypothetical protein
VYVSVNTVSSLCALTRRLPCLAVAFMTRIPGPHDRVKVADWQAPAHTPAFWGSEPRADA